MVDTWWEGARIVGGLIVIFAVVTGLAAVGAFIFQEFNEEHQKMIKNAAKVLAWVFLLGVALPLWIGFLIHG